MGGGGEGCHLHHVAVDGLPTHEEHEELAARGRESLKRLEPIAEQKAADGPVADEDKAEEAEVVGEVGPSRTQRPRDLPTPAWWSKKGPVGRCHKDTKTETQGQHDRGVQT